jgi:hypothetical protein
MATNYLNATAETVLPGLRQFFGDPEKFNYLFNKMKKVKPEMVTERDFRAPYKKRDIGRFGTYNPAGGALGRGRAADTGVMIGSFYSFRMNYELTQLDVMATKEAKNSNINAFKDALKVALPNFALMIDKTFHTDGDAVLGTAVAVGTWSGGTKTVYTMDTTTSVKGIRRGLGVILYLNNLSAARDSGTVHFIEQVDEDARKIYMATAVPAAGADDKVLFEGVSGASPTGPYGLYMYNTTSTSGSLHGITRTNEIALNPVYVDGLGSPTPLKMMQAVHGMLNRWGEMPKGGFEVLCATTQQANMWKYVREMSIVDLSKASINQEVIDTIPTNWKWGTIPMRLDLNQRTDRMDGIVYGEWTRPMLPGGDLDFFTTPGTSERFFTLYDSGGSPAAAVWFGLIAHFNFMNARPGYACFVGNLNQPTY